MISHNSITLRVALNLGVSSLVLVLFLSVLTTRFIQKQYQQVEEEVLAAWMDDALSTLGINLSYEFFDAVTETGNRLLARDGILHVEIVPEAGAHAFVFSREQYDTAGNTFSRTMEIRDPVTEQRIGTLSVLYSRERYRRMMSRFYRYQLAVLGIYLLFIGFLVHYLLKKFRPLSELADNMQAFDPQKTVHLLDYPDTGDEIARIAGAATVMLENIREYSRQLEKANQELKISHDELEERVRERTEELKEKQVQLAHAGRLASLGELAAGIAHELGQPLQIINTAAEIVVEEFEKGRPDPEEILPIARKISVQVDRAQAIIRNMRTFARYDRTKRPMPLDIEEPLRECLGFFREQFYQHGIGLELECPRDLPQVRADFQKFQQIIVNLLSNARYAVDQRAVKEPGFTGHVRVIVEFDVERKQVILKVRDNGIGMGEQEKERCLEPFFTTKSPGDGTGLGLSIAYGLVKEFGFILEISSRKNEGSVFRILMPVCRKQV